MADIKFDKEPSNNEAGLLATLWRNILRDNNMSPEFLSLLVDEYINTTHKLESDGGDVKPLKRKSKSTMINNITDTQMTIKTFMDLLLNLIKVRKVAISVKLTYNNGDETVHTVVVNNKNNKGKKNDRDNTKSDN